MLEPFFLGAVSAPVVYGIVYLATEAIMKKTGYSPDAGDDVLAGE